MHSLCSAYGWSYKDTMKLTLPIVYMLNHAAHREFENSRIRAEYKAKKEKVRDEKDPVLPEYGCRLSELSEKPEMLERYLSDWTLR